MVTFLIPSLDRPSQLDCLLSSIEKFWKTDFNVAILYKYTLEEYGHGYEIVADKHLNCIWLPQYEFCHDWKWLLDKSKEQVCLCTDDTVFFDYPPTDWEEFFTEDVHCTSFRLSPLTRIQNYLTNETQPQIDTYDTKFIAENYNKSMVKWHYKRHNRNLNYGYQFSLDACIYRKSDLLKYIIDLNFENPRALEWQLNNKIDRNSLPNHMICPINQCAFVNTVNCVQKDGPPAGKKYYYSPKELNNKFLSRERISLESFKNLNLRSCHEEFPLIFERY